MYPNFSGQIFGEYQLQNMIGRGGMAVVYRARQVTLNRDVAVKIIPTQLGGGDFAARFKREADLIARLEHPHILPIYTYGQHGDFLYLVVRLMEGGSLDKLIVGKPLPLADIDRLVGQIASALDYAHTHDIVHRDLKPNNILLDRFGNAYLMDFGIAKILTGTQLTSTSALMGTPAYMAPEQWMMAAIDHRADIYSLGIIVYEMLTGRVPFDAPTPHQLMYAHLNLAMPPPSQIIPGLMPAIDEVIAKATAKEPPDRYNTGAELAEALSKAIQGQQVDVRGELTPLTMRPFPAASPTPVTFRDDSLATFTPTSTPSASSPPAFVSAPAVTPPAPPPLTQEKTEAAIPTAGIGAAKRQGRGFITAAVIIGLLLLVAAGVLLSGVLQSDNEGRQSGGTSIVAIQPTVTEQESATGTPANTVLASATRTNAPATATSSVTVTTMPSATDTVRPTATVTPVTPTVDIANFVEQTLQVQQTVEALVTQRLAQTLTVTASTKLPSPIFTVAPSLTPTALPTLTLAPTFTPLPTATLFIPSLTPLPLAATNTPYFLPPSTAASAILCPGRLPSIVSVGIRARTTFTDGTATNVRATPGGTILARIPEGQELEVVGGPVCRGDYTWWQIRLPNATVGWVAEGEPGRYFIEPLPGVVIASERVLQSTSTNPNPQVRVAPSTSATVIRTLFPGDRVGWQGALLVQEGSTWAIVTTYDGLQGYAIFRPDWLTEVNPRATTFGLALDSVVRVLPPGDLANLRVGPDTDANRLQVIRSGTAMQVIGGPRYADYFMWWQYRLSDGTVGWIVDVPGWFTVIR